MLTEVVLSIAAFGSDEVVRKSGGSGMVQERRSRGGGGGSRSRRPSDRGEPNTRLDLNARFN